VSARDLPFLRDPAVLLIDQLKEVYIDGELETIDTTNWFPKVMRRTRAASASVGNGNASFGVPPNTPLTKTAELAAPTPGISPHLKAGWRPSACQG
jgi:hypothetical protein